MGYSSLSNEKKGKKNIDHRDGYTNARRLINISTKICLARSFIRGNFNATLVAHPFKNIGNGGGADKLGSCTSGIQLYTNITIIIILCSSNKYATAMI